MPNNQAAPKEHKVGPHGQFKCATGGEWKPITGFSNKNAARLEGLLRRGKNIDASNTGMICREHSEAPTEQLKCGGPCGLHLPLDDFSKVMRRNKLPRCKKCVAWAACVDPNVAPFAAPNTMVSHDEAMQVQYIPHSQEEMFTGYEADKPTASFSHPAGRLVSEENDDPRSSGPLARRMARSPSVADNAATVPADSTSVASSKISALPPHLRSVYTSSSGSTRQGGTIQSFGAGQGRTGLPPHFNTMNSTATSSASSSVKDLPLRPKPSTDFDSISMVQSDTASMADSVGNSSAFASNAPGSMAGPWNASSSSVRTDSSSVPGKRTNSTITDGESNWKLARTAASSTAHSGSSGSNNWSKPRTAEYRSDTAPSPPPSSVMYYDERKPNNNDRRSRWAKPDMLPPQRSTFQFAHRDPEPVLDSDESADEL